MTTLSFLVDPYITVLMLTIFASVGLFAYTGVRLFASGWVSYEQKYLEDAEKNLDAIYLTIPPQHVLYLSALCFVLFAVFWSLLLGNMLFGVIFGLMGIAFPKLLLWWLRRRRSHKFDHQLVEALTNMGNSLKAGFSLSQAIELVSREMQNPMGQEMGMVVRELQVGADLSEALNHLYIRMPGQDLDLIISSILISREVGGDLTEIFDNIASTIRERHRIEGKVRALTSQGKLQGAVIICIPPAMALALSYIAPSMVRPLYTTPIGWMLIGVVLILMSAGVYTIHKIVSIEV